MASSHFQEPRPDDVAQVQKRALAIAKDFPAEGAPIPHKDSFVASVDAVAEAAYHLQWTEPEVAVGLHGLATVLNAARGFQAVSRFRYVSVPFLLLTLFLSTTDAG
jgi:hypothetical protein